MIADLRTRSGVRIATATIKAERSIISELRIVTISVGITRKTFINGVSIPIGGTIFAPANAFPVECG